MYIPDVTKKYDKKPFASTLTANPYYHKLLPKKMRRALKGYFATLEDLDDAFDNVTEDEDVEEAFNRVGLSMSGFRNSWLVSEEKAIGKELTPPQHLIINISDSVKEYLKSEYNQVVISLIDSLDNATYRKRYKKVFGVNYDVEE